jgi:hypothetical protein
MRHPDGPQPQNLDTELPVAVRIPLDEPGLLETGQEAVSRALGDTGALGALTEGAYRRLLCEAVQDVTNPLDDLYHCTSRDSTPGP